MVGVAVGAAGALVAVGSKVAVGVGLGIGVAEGVLWAIACWGACTPNSKSRLAITDISRAPNTQKTANINPAKMITCALDILAVFFLDEGWGPGCGLALGGDFSGSRIEPLPLPEFLAGIGAVAGCHYPPG